MPKQTDELFPEPEAEIETAPEAAPEPEVSTTEAFDADALVRATDLTVNWADYPNN